MGVDCLARVRSIQSPIDQASVRWSRRRGPLWQRNRPLQFLLGNTRFLSLPGGSVFWLRIKWGIGRRSFCEKVTIVQNKTAEEAQKPGISTGQGTTLSVPDALSLPVSLMRAPFSTSRLPKEKRGASVTAPGTHSHLPWVNQTGSPFPTRRDAGGSLPIPLPGSRRMPAGARVQIGRTMGPERPSRRRPPSNLHRVPWPTRAFRWRSTSSSNPYRKLAQSHRLPTNAPGDPSPSLLLHTILFPILSWDPFPLVLSCRLLA